MHSIVGDCHCTRGDAATVNAMHSLICLFKLHCVVGLNLDALLIKGLEHASIMTPKKPLSVNTSLSRDHH
jgi:hypothetical protein